MRGGDLDGQEFFAEVKKYSVVGDQAAEYDEYLAKCYRAFEVLPARCDHFFWVTWHPFSQSKWPQLCQESEVRSAVMKHRERCLGSIDEEAAQAKVDSRRCAEVARRLWLVVLSEKQGGTRRRGYPPGRGICASKANALIEAHDTAAEIREALALPRTVESAQAVKQVVARSIRAVDSGVAVETTDYFNHSFAPDFVLTWQRASAREERYVFLRFNTEPGWIADELSRLENRHPVIYGLAAMNVNGTAKALAKRSLEAETLVTDPEAVDKLAAVPPSGIGSFVSRTLIRGGRGLVDCERALRATTVITGGFDAAREADRELTKLAVDTAQEFLRPVEASRVLRFLQAIWVGSGGAAPAFPGPTTPTGDPGDEGLRFLIESEPIADTPFWRALGGSLSIERLATLGISGSPPNLQHIIGANLDRLWARTFRVRADQPRLDDSGERLLWRMESGLLALAGSNFTAYLSSAVDDLAGIKNEPGVGVTVETLQ